jgi:hypothetical protein
MADLIRSRKVIASYIYSWGKVIILCITLAVAGLPNVLENQLWTSHRFRKFVIVFTVLYFICEYALSVLTVLSIIGSKIPSGLGFNIFFANVVQAILNLIVFAASFPIW